MDGIHDAITTAIRGDVLTRDRLERVLRDLAAEAVAQPEQLAAQRRALEGDLARVAGRLEKLAVALEEGGELKALVDRMKAGERERQALQARLEHLDGLSRAVVAAGGGRLRAQAELLVANWSEAMSGDPVVSRQVLRKVLESPIEMAPEEAGGWSYSARVGLGRVLGGELDGEAWRVSIGQPRVEVDVDEEVKAILKGQIGALEASRLSGSRSSPSWR